MRISASAALARRASFVTLVGLLIATAAMAQPIWDETTNGMGDAGNFPTGGYQNAMTSGFTSITGILENVDVDAYCIQINSATWSADVVSGAETDTRLWLFDENGVFMMGNDDSSPTGGTLQSFISDTTSFPAASDGSNGTLIDGPTDATAPERAVLVINGFADDALDTLAVPLTGMNASFDALVGIDPASTGIFGSWEGGAQGGGSYEIALSGAEVCPDTLPVTLQSFSIE